MIEVEKRGRLDEYQEDKLRTYLQDHGKLIGKFKQLNIFIEFGNSYLGNIESTNASINISISKNLILNKVECKLKTKTGNMQSSARTESYIPFQIKDIEEIYHFLKIFKVENGCPRFYYREDYKYNNFSISIKEDGLAPNHFEVELLVDNKEDISNAIRKIDEFAKKLDLELYSEEEYKEIMLKVFAENPPVPLTTINLRAVE